MSSYRPGPIGVRAPASSIPPALVRDHIGERAAARAAHRGPMSSLLRIALRVGLVALAVLAVGRCSLAVTDRPRALGLSTTTLGSSVRDADRVVVVLHGFGGDEDDLARVAKETLALGAPERTAFVFAEGPYRAALGRAWWKTTDPAERADSVARVSALIDSIVEKTGLPRSRVYLAGFSQGAALALDVLLERPDTLGGAVALSPCADRIGWSELASAHAPVRAVIVHGKDDRVCPSSGAERIQEAFAAGGHSVDLVVFDGSHQVTADGERALATMLRAD